MRLTAVTALALVCAPHPVLTQDSCSPRDTARTREELVGDYNTFREAFVNNAPQAWIDALAPLFTLTLFDGKVMSKDWVENYVRTNAAQFRIRTLAKVVQSITRPNPQSPRLGGLDRRPAPQ
jgi:hypothetical protein